MMKLKLAISLLFVLFLSSCSTFKEGDIWPEGLPPQSHFVAAFQADTAAQRYQTQEEYLSWVIRFYEGNALTDGWLGLTEQVLERLEEPQLSIVKQRIFDLGSRIGTEWPKDNQVRKLNTRTAGVWREALLEALALNDLDNYLTRVEKDVEDILMGALDKDQIQFERYYEDDFEF